MKGAISISLYGDGAKYSVGALENARLAKTIYPGWVMLFHVDKGHPVIPKLLAEGAEVIEHEKEPGSGGMFWRFYTADDSRFTHTIIRDADSRLNVRDKAATDAWIESGKSLHVIWDDPWHKNRKIIGGAWGIKNKSFEQIEKACVEWPDHSTYGDDENFLDAVIWPKFADTTDFIRHSFSPDSKLDTTFPDHAPYEGFVCEQIVPTFSESFEAFVISPEKYAVRRERFFASLSEHGGFLKDKVTWRKGKTQAERVVPPCVDHSSTYPHYYLASKEHIDLLEYGILKNLDYLFVFEDDAKFNPDFEEYFLRSFVSAPSDFKAIVLGGQPQTDDRRFHTNPPLPHCLAEVRGTLGMHGTLWSRAGMLRAFDHFTYWNRMTIDQAFRGLQHDERGYYAPAKWVVEIDPLAKQFGRDK
jgi:hypothetical protein